MTLSAGVSLMHEALSRARMRSPQKIRSEASSHTARRGARRIAMQARHQQAVDLGTPMRML